jgi:hypothetical protein
MNPEGLPQALADLWTEIWGKHGTSPVFFDVVSVELANKKEYNVYWWGSEARLKVYEDAVNTYFKNPNNQSLLFLQFKENRRSLHEYFRLDGDEVRQLAHADGPPDRKSKKISLDNFGKIIGQHERNSHLKRWQDYILKRLGLAFFSFSKIEFAVATQRYAAAIWIGYDCYPKRRPNEHSEDIIEKFLWSYALNSIASENQNELALQATRAAISQVMARNMSHNIGSHVLSKFKDRNDICNISPSGGQYDGSAYNTLFKPRELRLREQIAYFNEYLKNRMDFLADIATSDPVMENAMLLKNDIFKGFDRNRILLNRISGVSDKDFRFRIVLKKNGAELEDDEDVILSITNDVLGAQAFYILLENIIRNVAKHSKIKRDEKSGIEITVDVADFPDNLSFYGISIYDNLKKTASEINDIVRRRNEAFDQTVLENNKLRDNNLGTIEMDVCAAYLRCQQLTCIEDVGYRVLDDSTGELAPSNPCAPKLLHAYGYPLNPEEDEYSLAYKLYVSKPKEILVIDDGGDFAVEGLPNEELVNYGILVIKSDQIDGNIIYNHQIRYYHSKLTGDPHSAYVGSLPKRVVGKLDGLTFDTPQDFIALAWEKYAVSHFLKAGAVKIINAANSRVLKGVKGRLSLAPGETRGTKTIFIDNHNRYWCGKCAQVGDGKDCECKSESYGGPQYFYYDMACSHSKVASILTHVTSKNFSIKEFTVKKAEYLEVVFCKVLIIDERIQENVVLNAKKYYGPGGETNFYRYFAKQNVLIPSMEEANLNDLNFGTLADAGSVSHKIRDFILHKGEDATFYVVHLGILEKMMDSAVRKDEQAVEDILGELFPGGERKKVVITSGRGKPNNLPKDISFVPLALIQNALETVFDKFVLTKILYNSRKAK